MPEVKTWLVPREKEGDIVAIAQHIKEVVKLKAKGEIEAGVSGVQNEPWFIEKHLEVVEDRVNWVLDNCSGAEGVDRNEALIATWTHDLGRIMGWNDSHAGVSALKTRQWLLDNGLGQEIADRIFNANLRHGAQDRQQPEKQLERVIASADALSHFDGCESGSMEDFLERKGFWYLFWLDGIKKGSSDEQILKRSFKKMGRDASSKQGFKESKERAEKECEFLRNNASGILQRIRRGI